MSVSKIGLIMVGAVVVGGGALLAVGEVSRLHLELTEKQHVIARLTAQTEELQRQVETAQADRKQVEARLAEVREGLEAASQELSRVRSASTEARLRSEELSTERDQLESQVKRLMRERDEALEQVTQFGSEKTDLEHAVAKYRERWKFLDRDYQRLAERLKQLEQQAAQAKQPVVAKPGEFGLVASTAAGTAMTPATAPEPPVVPPDIAPAMAPDDPSMPMSSAAAVGAHGAIELPPIVVQKGQAWSGFGVRARVIEVNDQHRFVVLDKGADDGILVGTTFSVLRGGSPVGAVVAVRVRPRLAACDLIPSRSPEPLQVGDLAVPQSSS